MKKIIGDKVRWGIIGVGKVCELKSAPAMQLVPGSELIAVMRRTGSKAKDYAERHKVPKWYDDATELINDPEINAIYIATPPDAHLEYTIQAAKAQKPVYVEKPMARTYEECQAMIQVCQQAQVPLYVAYYRRTLPHFLKVKSLIENNAIGEVRLVNIELYKTMEPDILAHADLNWRVKPEIAGGGYFYDLASHQLDYLDFLFGPIVKVNGFARNQGGQYVAEDIVSGSFVFENGVVGTGSWCFTVSELARKDSITIIGSQGKISFSTFGKTEIVVERQGKNTERLSFTLPKHIQYLLIEKIVLDLQGKAQCPSTGISAARTNWVMQEMTKH